jgi:hypothetical protein
MQSYRVLQRFPLIVITHQIEQFDYTRNEVSLGIPNKVSMFL